MEFVVSPCPTGGGPPLRSGQAMGHPLTRQCDLVNKFGWLPLDIIISRMLKRWNAVGFRRVLPNGRTKPLVIDCVEVPESVIAEPDSPELARCEFVVKAIGNPEVDKSLIVRELLGNLLAREYGLVTPEPALVQISEHFAKAVNPHLQKHGFQIQPGIASGSEFISGGFSPPPEGSFFTNEELGALALLYGFDLVSQNPDRLPTRPNCGMIGSRLVAFDFDQCFSFLYLIFQIGQPWEVSRHGIASKHVCHLRLKSASNPIDWAANINAVASLSDELLSSLTSWIPDEWADNTAKVKSHLAEIRSHLGAFEMELQGSVQ